MAYNFLELVNSVNRRVNEVPLTSTSFGPATGYYNDVKGHINTALNRINREEFEWPFNHITHTEVLTPDQPKYSYPAETKSVAFDTFCLAKDSVLNTDARRLDILDYEQYLNAFPDYEFNPSLYSDVPTHVVRRRDLAFSVYPPPKEAYTLRYEYYRFPPDLVEWDDVPTVPDPFKWVILEGAMYYAYMFRGGLEEASISNQLFQAGLKDMRKLYINRTEYARSTVIRS